MASERSVSQARFGPLCSPSNNLLQKPQPRNVSTCYGVLFLLEFRLHTPKASLCSEQNLDTQQATGVYQIPGLPRDKKGQMNMLIEVPSRCLRRSSSHSVQVFRFGLPLLEPKSLSLSLSPHLPGTHCASHKCGHLPCQQKLSSPPKHHVQVLL